VENRAAEKCAYATMPPMKNAPAHAYVDPLFNAAMFAQNTRRA
jgi:hypothetical protein